MSLLRSTLASMSAAGLLAACMTEPPTAPRAPVGAPLAKTASRLKVTPPQLAFTAIGETATLTTTTPATGAIVLTVSDPTCVSVSPRRLNRSPGKFTVAATAVGNCTVTVTDGSGTSAVIPVRVTALLSGTIVAGVQHTCGLTSNGAAYCWGRNTQGELGNSTNLETSTPNPSPLLVQGGLAFTTLAAGSGFTCGLTAAGPAYCWGNNAVGSLGNPTNSGTLVPNPAPLPVSGNHMFVALKAGNGHACGLTADGTVYCWGYNLWGQLGTEVNAGGVTPTPTPTPVASSAAFTQIAAGESHTCGLTAAGAAWCWGRNNFGQLGTTLNLNTSMPTPTPQLVAGDVVFASLIGGGTHTCGLTAAGAAYCWGNNDRGQLGTTLELSTGVPVTAPTPVEGNLIFISLTAGHAHSCGLVAGGGAYCWGSNVIGQLGSATESSQPSPTPKAVGGGLSLIAISAGYDYTCGVTSLGAGYCWGDNLYGQLGSSSGGQFTSDPQAVSGGLVFARP